MRPPQQNSPRPSSVSSCQSSQSYVPSKRVNRNNRHGKGLLNKDICVGEDLKIAVTTAVERFRLSEEQLALEFPSSLTSTERAYIHRYVQGLGLKSKSRGKGSNRCLTVTKKEGLPLEDNTVHFTLTRNSRHHVTVLAQKCPLSNKERQDLVPRTDRSQYSDGFSKEFVRASTGRLNNGVPQVPGTKGQSDLEAFRKTLPVYKQGEDIIRTINNNRVIMISGETGSGKTTQVPQMILDDCHERNKACRIFCTQPRRISAVSVAERVAQERGEKIGHTVGYQIRLESRTSPKTLLTFCTNGVLLRTLMGGDSLSTLTHVIVDEVHERDRFSDFLMISLRELLNKHRTLKVILMSATLNVQLFSQYFQDCPVISIPGNLFPVEEYFLEDVLKMTNYSNKKMDKLMKSQEFMVKQQETIDNWCKTAGVPQNEEGEEEAGAEDDEGIERDEDRADEENVFDETEDDIEVVQIGEESEDLPPEIQQEMDALLSRVWLEGDAEPFHRIYHLIANQNVSVDYQHSETSVTPLMTAAGRGFLQHVEILLHLGADPSLKASNEWTTLDWARTFERSEICNLIESHLAVSDGLGDETHDVELEKESDELSDADKLMLDAYHKSWDDAKVDLDLVLALVHSIHSGKREGAILVFLPGYDDIVTLRDFILEDKRFSDSNRYIIYTLHSMMQCSDQRRVFKTPASGVRKIILSTNIAETSVTINDVVFVIDAGKVKEKSYDALTSVTMLKSHWVSRAAAQQRRGRAGRCQEGMCYHLFSKARYNTFLEYAVPEILRQPLQGLCLDTKLLAPVNTSIADFLAKAPDPPAFLIIRNAVHLLKQMDALDPFEDLTELGHHLADLPVEPKFGKMLLYGVVLKCLDPVLTIASTMAYKDPFVMPMQPYLKRSAQFVRRSFADHTFSDHMCVLRAFQAWQKAKMEGYERSFCEKNFISASTMETIMGTRTSILGQLRASGFVRARGGGDIRDLNTNSENWAVVKAALCAGNYPCIVRADRKKGVIISSKENKIRLHPSSVLSGPPDQVMSSRKEHREVVNTLPTDWLIYDEMTRTHLISQVKACTVVSSVTVALFGGPAKLPCDTVKAVEDHHMPSAAGGMVAEPAYDNTSDSDEEEGEEGSGVRIVYPLDDWIHFRIDSETANKVLLLRQKWHSLFLRRMRNPSKTLTQSDEQIIRAVVSVLTNEEQALGLQQPAGIGQRPRPMSAETPFSSGGSRHNSLDLESEDDQEKNPATPKARPFKFYQNSPKRREFLKFPRGDDRSDSGSVRSNNSGPGSQRGSNNSTPCPSPQPGAATRSTEAQSRYFIMKSLNHKSLDISMHKEQWATHPINEKKLNRAFQEGRDVHLVFSVQGSGHFQGVAKMTSQSGSERGRDFGSGFSFGVEWIKRANLPFNQCHHLQNAWNENKRVQISRDGQEVEPSVGELLVKLWDKLPHHIPRIMLKEDKSQRHGGGGDGAHAHDKAGAASEGHDYSHKSYHGQGHGGKWVHGGAYGGYRGSPQSGAYGPPMQHYGPPMYVQPHAVMGQGQMIAPPHHMYQSGGRHGHVAPVTILQRSNSNDGHTSNGSSRGSSGNGQ